MKKTILISLLLSILLSMVILPANAESDATADDLWIPVRNSKVSASTEYPLYPTYQYTSDGVQIAHPDYPEGIPAASAYVSGVAHNRKYAVDGFSIKLKAADYHTGPDGYANSTWIAFCISDTADNLPIQGSSGNALHFQIQLSSPAGENLFEVRAYMNHNGTQGSAIKFGSSTYARYSYPSDGTITMSFAKSGSGYTIMVNGDVLGSTYAFNEIDTVVPDGKFYPVIGMNSRNVSNQNLKVNVLEMNGVKPVAPGDQTTTSPDTTSPDTTSPVTTALKEELWWVPVRNSKIDSATEYPLYPTYKYTSDGVQIAYPKYPADIAASTVYVSGIAHTQKYDINGFSFKFKPTDFHTGPTSNPNSTWIAFCISDTADNLPIQGGSGNALHFQIQLSSPAGENLFEVRAYLNHNGTQGSAINFGGSSYARYTYPADGTITLSFTKSGSGYTIKVNGEAFGSAYAFNEINTAVSDGKFYPVIGIQSRDVSNQNLKINVLEINGVKPTAEASATTVPGTPPTFDQTNMIGVVLLISFAGVIIIKNKSRRVLK